MVLSFCPSNSKEDHRPPRRSHHGVEVFRLRKRTDECRPTAIRARRLGEPQVESDENMQPVRLSLEPGTIIYRWPEISFA